MGPHKFVQKMPNLTEFIKKLKDGNKQIFLLTNSSYDYIDNACHYLFEDVVSALGLKHWTEVFNWTITRAQKPKWFNKNPASAGSKFKQLNIHQNLSSISGLNAAPFKAVDGF